jgi:hypothetical protein
VEQYSRYLTCGASVLGIASESVLGTAQNVKTIQLQALDEYGTHCIPPHQQCAGQNRGRARIDTLPEIPNFPFSKPTQPSQEFREWLANKTSHGGKFSIMKVGDVIHNESGTSSLEM